MSRSLFFKMLDHLDKLFGLKYRIDLPSVSPQAVLALGQPPWSKVWLFPPSVALKMLHFGKCSLRCRMRWLWFGNRPFVLITGINLIGLKLIAGISCGNKDNLLLIVILSSDVDSRLILSCERLR